MRPIQLVVITGRQADVRAHLAAIVVPPRHKVVLVGFTLVMHYYMRLTDLIVSKPGGLTTAESFKLATGTPMIIVSPIPCQPEERATPTCC